MAFKWVLHSACYLLRNPGEEEQGYCHGGMEISKVCNGEMSSKVTAMENSYPSGFQMPLHYPRYKKSDYEKMEEWKLDLLLQQYGLCFHGNLDEKRAFAMGAFLWPDQY